LKKALLGKQNSPLPRGGRKIVNFRDYILFADGKGFGLPVSGFRLGIFNVGFDFDPDA